MFVLTVCFFFNYHSDCHHAGSFWYWEAQCGREFPGELTPPTWNSAYRNAVVTQLCCISGFQKDTFSQGRDTLVSLRFSAALGHQVLRQHTSAVLEHQ